MKVLFSLLLGGLILYWMYRDFDFKNVGTVLVHEMDWTWMLLSFPFGVLAQMLRGWRWQMSLEPIGEHARASVSVNSIFLSYAVSLVVPRVGEFARCGVLKRYDGVSFTKALGTVVTERIIDSLLLLAITLVTLFFQLRVFDSFSDAPGPTSRRSSHGSPRRATSSLPCAPLPLWCCCGCFCAGSPYIIR